MRVIIAAIGSGGDLNPMLAVGVELARRGHEVTVLAGEWQESKVRAVGVGFHSAVSSAQFDSFRANAREINVPGGGWMAFFHDVVMPSIRTVLEYVQSTLQPGNTVLIGSSHAIGFRLAEERFGVPLITTRVQPQTLEDENPDPEKIESFNRIFTPKLNLHRRRLGLAAIDQPFDRWLISLDRAVAFFPDWFITPSIDSREQGRMIDFVFYDPAGPVVQNRALDVFLACKEPPIVFTHGTGNDAVGDFFEIAAEVSNALGRPAILLSAHLGRLSERLPANILHVDYFPFERLLPFVEALVHHGGIGTCAQALKAGIPQLVVPLGFDQHQNAARIESLGVGMHLKSADFNHASLKRALSYLLGSPEVAAHCRQYQAKFASDDALARLCNAIEEMAVG